MCGVVAARSVKTTLGPAAFVLAVMASCTGANSSDVEADGRGGPSDQPGTPGPEKEDARSEPADSGGAGDAGDAGALGFGEADWTPTALAQSLVPGPQLKPMPGAMAGPPIWISNNPELYDSTGWLMQGHRSDAARGGKAWSSAGKSTVYLFGINRMTGGTYTHVVVTNPQTTPVTVSGRGSMYTNREKPATGPARGQSYAVADDWLRGTLASNFGPITIAPGQSASVANTLVLEKNMVDGRFELDSSAGVSVATAIAVSSSAEQAISNARGAPAKGFIVGPGPNEYGRCAGVYAGSAWRTKFDVEVPKAPAYLGFALNTNAKFVTLGARLQDQTVPALMAFTDSGERTYGNYGAEYDVKVDLINPSSASRKVTLSFATMETNTIPGQDFSWDGPVAVDGKVIPVYNTPAKPRQSLGSFTLAANERRQLSVRFYVPGLIIQGPAARAPVRIGEPSSCDLPVQRARRGFTASSASCRWNRGMSERSRGGCRGADPARRQAA